MSYYLFEQNGRIWRSICSGSVDRNSTFSVLAMTEAVRDTEGVYHGKSADASAYPDEFSEKYVSLLYYLFGCRTPSYLTNCVHLVEARRLLHDEFIHPYAFTIHSVFPGSKKAVPKATRHACWQILRQIAYRPEKVKKVVCAWSKVAHGDRTSELAAEMWYDGVVEGDRGENFSYSADRIRFVSRLAGVLSGKKFTTLPAIHSWSSSVFS